LISRCFSRSYGRLSRGRIERGHGKICRCDARPYLAIVDRPDVRASDVEAARD
jgi:hypothetical protein